MFSSLILFLLTAWAVCFIATIVWIGLWLAGIEIYPLGFGEMPNSSEILDVKPDQNSIENEAA